MKNKLSRIWVVSGSVSLRKFFISGSVALLCGLAASSQATVSGPITLNFANLPNTEIDFSGGAFSFTSTNGYQFNITSVNGGIGDSVGFQGYIAPGGPFTMGTITTNGSIQTASVTGTGMLHITDSASHDLTGSIQWDDITTIGAGGILNLTGTINLTALMYSGGSSDLAALASAGSAADVVTFQFTPAENLSELETTGGETSYSGSIAATPEPTVFVLLGFGMASFVAFRRRSGK